MMKRRWSNNGGFTSLRMLDESSSEVTSSSAALVMSPGMTMSPTSLGSPEYNELELWGPYDENVYNGHSVLSNGNNNVGGCGAANNLLMNGLVGNNNLNGMMNMAAAGQAVPTNGNNIQHIVGNLINGINQNQTLIPPLPSIIQNTIMNTPRSESVNSISSGREDLSPSSSLNGYSGDGNEAKKQKKGPTPRQQEELCLVCGDRASGYHYNALTCEGCKGFFRRSVTKNAVYCCKFGHACEMDMYMRRKCQECRLKKCLAVGMRPECVVPENQCAIKRKEKKAQKEKDKLQTNATVSTTNNTFKSEILPALMKCDPPPHAAIPLLPEKLLNENRLRNIPLLTANQMSVIYKLIWYQDGYEQPSEEDLKRIMIQGSPNDDEDQHDVHFRHITEITILTVQLIVEFAKGLPAFTKIPQEDQITLLKACSSEVMMLRMARRYDASTDSILFANNRSYTRESYRMAGMADTIEDLLHFCRQMYALTVDNVEYALLTAIVIFSDRPGLEQAELVEHIQSYYIDTLRIYILNRHGGDPKCSIIFAKLLSILTELRTLGNQNSEMCFSLKLKNRKLPRFLEEIWDVQDIPPALQVDPPPPPQHPHPHHHHHQQQHQQHLSDKSASSASSSSAVGAANASQLSSSSTNNSSSSSSSSSSNGSSSSGNNSTSSSSNNNGGPLGHHHQQLTPNQHQQQQLGQVNNGSSSTAATLSVSGLSMLDQV